jgi:hypothetical protein
VNRQELYQAWRFGNRRENYFIPYGSATDGEGQQIPDGTCTDSESLKFRWQFRSRRGKLKSIPDGSAADGESFPDGRSESDAASLSRWLLPSGNVPWRFSVRNARLSVSFLSWRFIPDGNRHGLLFLTVLDIFLDGNDRQEKTCLGWWCIACDY